MDATRGARGQRMIKVLSMMVQTKKQVDENKVSALAQQHMLWAAQLRQRRCTTDFRRCRYTRIKGCCGCSISAFHRWSRRQLRQL